VVAARNITPRTNKKSSKKVEGDLTKSPQKEVSVIFSYNNFAFWRSKLWPTHQDYRRSYSHCWV